jgi:hypothetical protein
MQAQARRPETGEPNRVFYAKSGLNRKKMAPRLVDEAPFSAGQ